MLSQLKWMLLMLGCFLPGCMNANSVAIGPKGPSRETTDAHSSTSDDDFDVDDSFELDDPAAAQDALAGLDRAFLKEQLLLIPPGSQVSLVDESGRRYMGTLLSADADGVELKNCVCKETVPGLHGQRQCRTSHVPYESLATSSLTHFILTSPPPPDKASQDLAEDGGDVTVEALVYKSGRRQRWGRPLERGESAPRTDYVEEQR